MAALAVVIRIGQAATVLSGLQGAVRTPAQQAA